MATKRSSKWRSRSSHNSKHNWLMGVVIGVFLSITLGNIQTSINSFEQQQLVELQSDTFASHNYQPIQLGSSDKIAQTDFTVIDRRAKELSYLGTSITELADLLAANSNTEVEKARIIYAWVAQHITYDVPAFLDAVNNNRYPEVDPETVLRDRTTICSGFSNLYYALAEAMNLESVIVVGYGKGATPLDEVRFQDVNHAWNAVQIEGGWYLLDATWGAGSVIDEQFKPNYNPYYFATAPKRFINNHFPQDEAWQLLAQTYTRADFNNLPTIYSRFYNLGLELVSHHDYQIAAANRVDIELKAPQDTMAIAQLHQGTQEISATAVLVNRHGDNLRVSVAPPATGIYDLTVYAKQKDDPGKYGEVINYQIQAAQSTQELPVTYGHFQQHQVSLIEPLTRDLQPNWSTYFNLVVPQAIDVQVVNTTTNKWTPLDGYGDYFAGHVDIRSGKTIVIAKFPEDEQYWQLVEYGGSNE